MTELSQPLVAFLLAYWLHSTLLLGAAFLLTALLGRRKLHWQGVLWKLTLVAGLVTSSLQICQPQLARGVVLKISGTSQEFGSTRPISPLESSNSPMDSEDLVKANTFSTVDSIQWNLQFWPGLSLFFFLVWTLGSVLRVGRLIHRETRTFFQLAHGTERDSHDQLERFVSDMSERMGLQRKVQIFLSPGVRSPLAYGRRRVFLPSDFVAQPFHSQQAELAHEIAHLRRGDPLWSLGSAFITAVFFFQPLNIWARRRLLETMEYACDREAVTEVGSPIRYARALAEAVEREYRRAEEPELEGASFLRHPKTLAGRVAQILREEPGGRPRRAVIFLTASCCALLLALPLFPSVSVDSEIRTDSRGESLWVSEEGEPGSAWTEFLIGEQDSDRQQQMVEAAARGRDPSLIPWFLRLAERHPGREVRQQAVESLLAYPSALVLADLDRLSREATDREVRRQAVENLGRLRTPQARRLLEKIVTGHPEDWLREEALIWLQIKPPDQGEPR